MQEKILELLNEMIESASDETARILIRKLKEILSILEELFEKYQSDDPHITWTEFNKYNRLQKTLYTIDELLDGAYSDVIDLIRESEMNTEIESYYRHMHMFDMSSDINFLNDGLLYSNAKVTMEQPIEKIKLDKTFENHREATIKRIRGHLTTGVLDGKSYDSIAKDIENDIGMSARQSKRVARTEVGRAQSESQLVAEEQAKELGANIEGYWDATLDTRTRSSHQMMDSKKVDVDGNFNVGLSTGPAPRLLIGEDSASQNINCRCKKLYTVNGLKPTVRKARDKNGKSINVPYQTYEEWLSNVEETKGSVQNDKEKFKEMLENGYHKKSDGSWGY